MHFRFILQFLHIYVIEYFELFLSQYIDNKLSNINAIHLMLFFHLSLAVAKKVILTVHLELKYIKNINIS